MILKKIFNKIIKVLFDLFSRRKKITNDERNMDDNFTNDFIIHKMENEKKNDEQIKEPRKITKLSQEILDKIPYYKDRCVRDLYSGREWETFNPKISTEYIHKIYELAEQKNAINDFNKPVVIYADSPDIYKKYYRILHKDSALKVINRIYEAKNDISNEFIGDKQEQDLINEVLTNTELTPEDEQIQVKWHYLYLCSIYHRIYLTWYKFIQDEFHVDHENKETLDWLYERANNNISRCYFTTLYTLVLKTPMYIKRNENGFHCIDGAAIEWPDYRLYYINGRKIEEDIFLKVINKTFTFKEFTEIDDEDTKAVVITLMKEKFGESHVNNFLGAVVVDEKKIKHSSGHVEVFRLWKTKESYEFLHDMNGNPNQPYAWVEMTCPSSGAVYMVDTSAHFTDAEEAGKFARPERVSMEIPYDWKVFNS